MKKFLKTIKHLANSDKKIKDNEKGFSLLELVVAIGILLILTVGGLVGYSSITDNARTAAAESAASEISTSVIVALSDNVDTNDAPLSGDDGGWTLKYTAMYPDMVITITPYTANASEYTITVHHNKQEEKKIVRKVRP